MAAPTLHIVYPERNTKLITVVVNNIHVITYSYQTPICYCGPLGPMRIKNSWGPTTGRHFKDAGAENYPIYTQEQLEERIKEVLIGTGSLLAVNKLTGETR